MNKGSDQRDAVETDFIRILIGDVIGTSQRHESDPSQSNRRHLIRAIFAAIEGVVWSYREHLVGIARSCDALTIEEELAFSEVTYSVTPQGKIVEVARYVPTLAMFRLTTKLAERLSEQLAVRFDGVGWETLNRAVDIRNRITHPKSERDLEIADADLTACRDGFDWLFEFCLMAMEAANKAFREHTDGLRAVLEDLKNGDPATLALYARLRDRLSE